MVRLSLLALVGLLGACGEPARYTSDFPTVSGQDAAIATIWDTYGAWPQTPPAVRWVTGAELNCAGGRGWWYAKDDCRAGTAYGAREIWVALPEGAPLSTTALAHELLHASRDMTREHDDVALWGLHRTDAESMAGTPGSLLHAATEALRAQEGVQ